jgi:non-specific serine/threonine protein kinase
LLIFSEDKDFERTSTFLEKSLELYRELDDRAGIAWVLTQLGIVAAIQGELIKAKKIHGESLALRLEVGNPWDIAQSFGNLASLAMQQKDNANGKQFAERALAWFQKAGDQRSIARITGDLAWIAGTEGDFSDAVALQTKSLAQLVQFGDDWSCAELLEGLASWAYEQGNSKRTAILLGAAEALRENVGMPLLGNEYDFYEKDLVTFWKRSGKKTFANAWAQGRAMTLEQVVEFVMQDSEAPQPAQTQKESFGRLTTREREAAILISQGKSNREIAKEMTVTVKTVEAYVTRILRKLGFVSRVKIATWVIDNDLN